VGSSSCTIIPDDEVYIYIFFLNLTDSFCFSLQLFSLFLLETSITCTNSL
jgi:hypothetical protein